MAEKTGKLILRRALLLQALLLLARPAGPIQSRELTKEVYEAAKKGFELYIGICEEGGKPLRSVCSDTAVDISSLALSDEPLKVSFVLDSALVDCRSGAEMLEKAKFREYWFFVLGGGEAVGTVGATYIDKWKPGSISRGGKEIYEIISFLEGLHPRSAGNRYDLLSLGWMGEWFIMVSGPEAGHLIVPVDSRFSLVYGIPESDDGKPNVVPLDSVLQKMRDEAAKRIEWSKKNPDSFR